MPVNVVISSNQGTFQGGIFSLGPLYIPSAFQSLAVNSITFNAATFISTSPPIGAYGVLIEPPSNNTVALTLKGVTNDTGILIAANLPTVIPFYSPTSPPAVGLASSAPISGVVTLTFF